jgi:hypothetical protein
VDIICRAGVVVASCRRFIYTGQTLRGRRQMV